MHKMVAVSSWKYGEAARIIRKIYCVSPRGEAD